MKLQLLYFTGSLSRITYYALVSAYFCSGNLIIFSIHFAGLSSLVGGVNLLQNRSARDFSLYTGRPCTSILKKYYEGKLKNNQRGGMKLVSISAVRLVIIVMVAYVIVLV